MEDHQWVSYNPTQTAGTTLLTTGVLAMAKVSEDLQIIKMAGLSSRTKAHLRIKAGEVKSTTSRSKVGNNLEAVGLAKASSHLDGKNVKCFRCNRILLKFLLFQK